MAACFVEAKLKCEHCTKVMLILQLFWFYSSCVTCAVAKQTSRTVFEAFGVN